MCELHHTTPRTRAISEETERVKTQVNHATLNAAWRRRITPEQSWFVYTSHLSRRVVIGLYDL